MIPCSPEGRLGRIGILQVIYHLSPIKTHEGINMKNDPRKAIMSWDKKDAICTRILIFAHGSRGGTLVSILSLTAFLRFHGYAHHLN
jgi:hypothetical protein